MEEDIKAKLAAIRSKFREITEVLVTEMPLNPESLLEVSVMDSAQAFLLKKDLYQEILQLIEIAKRVDEEDVTEQWERDCEEMLHALQAKYKIMFQAIGARLPEFFNLHDYYEIMLYADWTFSKTFMELVHEMWDKEVFEDNDDAQVYS